MSNIFIQTNMQGISLFIALLSVSSMASATDANEIDVSITGKLHYPPPCNVSTEVNVEFDDMLTTNVNAQRKDIPLTLNCAGAKKTSLLIASQDAACREMSGSGLIPALVV